MTPPAEVKRDIFKMTAAEMEETDIVIMPASLQEAVEELKVSSLAKDTLGSHIFEKFIEAKEQEWDRFRIAVTEWELQEYLDIY